MRKYGVIYADPPWRYKVWKGHGMVERHYPTMVLEDILALPVEDLADKDCTLFLWTTLPMLHEALQVIKAWGFTYKTTAFVWIKLNRHGSGIFWGMGYWTRANAEICLLARGGVQNGRQRTFIRSLSRMWRSTAKSRRKHGGALRL